MLDFAIYICCMHALSPLRQLDKPLIQYMQMSAYSCRMHNIYSRTKLGIEIKHTYSNHKEMYIAVAKPQECAL